MRDNAIFEEISRFFHIYFHNKKYFICIYGSYATGAKNNKSDIDLFIATDKYTIQDIQTIKRFVIKFHKENKLKLDNEVPYENKLLISYKDLEKAVFLCGFSLENNHFYIPKVVKTKQFLNSIEIRERLALNALTSPHIYLGSDLNHYLRNKDLAEKNIILLALDLIRNVTFDYKKLISKLLINANGREGEMYLGYNNYETVKEYLRKIFNRQISKMLDSREVLRRDKTFELVDTKSLKQLKKRFDMLK